MSIIHHHNTTSPQPAVGPVLIQQGPIPRSADRRVHCEKCDSWSKNRASYRSHVLYNKKHRKLNGEPEITRSCARCGQDFSRNWNMEQHIGKPDCKPRRDRKRRELERIADGPLAGFSIHGLARSQSAQANAEGPTEDQGLPSIPARETDSWGLNEFYVHNGSGVPGYVDMYNGNNFMTQTGPAPDFGLNLGCDMLSNIVMDDMSMMHNLSAQLHAAFDSQAHFNHRSSSNDMSTVALADVDLFGPVLNNF